MRTARVNAAPRRYGVQGAAHSFAGWAVVVAGSVVEALPFADFLACGQSATLCPGRPQKRHNNNLMRHRCSSRVSLPFLPSWSAFGFLGLDEDEDEEDAAGDLDCATVCEDEVFLLLLLLLFKFEFEDLELSERVRAVLEVARFLRLTSA